MKKLILTSLFAASVVGAVNAQNIVDFSGAGSVTRTTGAPRTSMGDDLNFILPNGLASFNLDTMQIPVWNTNTVASNVFVRVQFYSFYDDNAGAGQPAMNTLTNSYTVNIGSVNPGAFTYTITGLGALNCTTANTKGWDITYFTDSTMTLKNVDFTAFMAIANASGVPKLAGSSETAWFRNAIDDDQWTGDDFRIFAAPNDTLAPWIVMTPKGTKITGTITLQDWVPPTTGKAVSYELRDAGANVVYSGTVALDIAGAYTAIIPDTIPAGTYDMAFKGSTWLFKKNSVTIDGVTPIIGNDYSLLNGNCANADQAIDLSDYTQVVTAFNALLVDPNNGGLPSANWDALADVNGDAGVDLTDYTVVVSNFNALGD